MFITIIGSAGSEIRTIIAHSATQTKFANILGPRPASPRLHVARSRFCTFDSVLHRHLNSVSNGLSFPESPNSTQRSSIDHAGFCNSTLTLAKTASAA
jgi:hypothetical protein